MKLSPADFNAHLRHMGQNVQWRRAYACPCRDPYSGAAQPGCPQCAGKGKLWDAPQAGLVGLTGMQRQRQWAQMGLYEAGDVVVSLPSDSPIYAMGETDRVRFTDSSQAFSLTLTRGRDDAAWPWPIVQLNRLFFLNEDQQIVESVWPVPPPDPPNPDPPDPPDPPLPEPPFLTRWPTPADLLANAAPVPAFGQTYSITGRHYPEYFVWGDLVQTRHHHQGFDLPRHVVLRRFDLFGR